MGPETSALGPHRADDWSAMDAQHGAAEERAETLALDSTSFTVVLGCLTVAERAGFAQSNKASTARVQKLYRTLRDHSHLGFVPTTSALHLPFGEQFPLLRQYGVTNPVDLSRLRTPLPESSVEQLEDGAFGLGCCCAPTGISFAGFEGTVDVSGDREIPRSLVRVLSRLVVLRAGGRIDRIQGPLVEEGRIRGPLVALIKLLPSRHTRVPVGGTPCLTSPA